MSMDLVDLQLKVKLLDNLKYFSKNKEVDCSKPGSIITSYFYSDSELAELLELLELVQMMF
jgi:hypothetical protein